VIAKNQTIALPLRDLSDLLIPDPSPLSQGAVTPEAETYIIKKAKELSAKNRFGWQSSCRRRQDVRPMT
jgi:hypothetical protein